MPMDARPTYLIHYGIKGQQWGRRRYQNEDGSLTAAGKEHYDVGGDSNPKSSTKKPSRYKRGRQYSKEEQEYANKDVERQKQQSKEYQDYDREVKRLQKKYGFDENGNQLYRDEYHSKDQIKNAKKRYYEMQENAESLVSVFEANANKKARDHIVKKYGHTAVDDIKHYNNVNSVAFIGSLGLFAIGMFSLYKDRKNEEYHRIASKIGHY